MDLQDCIKFATENPVCFVATADGDQPRVRGFLMWYADESGFYFITMTPKEVSKQLQKNPKVELCFYNNPAELQGAKQMRVTGEVEFLDDEEIEEKAYQARSFLEAIAGKPIRPVTQVFRIATGEAHFWTMADILKEPELERLKF
jgi:pyridoxamine 5'-phosphate oxidase